MSILNNNLSKISEYNSILADKIRNYTFSSNANFELINSVSGDANLKYNGILLHNAENPQTEAADVFENFANTSEGSINVIIGLGLGYLFKRFFLSSKGNIIVYEPNLDILRFTLEVVDFTQELSDKRVFIANTRLELMKFLDEVYLHKAKLNICGLISANSLYQEELASLNNDLSFIQGHLESNYKCLFEKSFLWAKEGITNLPVIFNSYNIDSLRDKFNSKPAIVVSSGPSLDKYIDELKASRDKVILFCVGNAYKALISNGINPDFLVFIEAQGGNTQVKNMDISDTNLIIQTVANSKSMKLEGKRKFIFYSNNDLISRWLSDLSGFPLEDYENKGNVSYCAMYSAYMMGCSPIILLGQDLAYTDGKCYSSGSAYGSLKCKKDINTGNFVIDVDNIQEFAKYYFDLEDQNLSDEELMNLTKGCKLNNINSQIALAKGQNGEMLPTDPNYASFIKFFEEFAYDYSTKTELINSSTDGAQVNGFKNVSLSDVLNNYGLLNFDTDSVIESAVQNYNDLVKQNISKIHHNMSDMIQAIEKFVPLAEEALKKSDQLYFELNKIKFDLNKIRTLSNYLINSYMKFKDELYNNYQIITGCTFKEILELSRILEGEANISGLEDLLEIAKASRDFYTVFIKNVPEFKNILIESADRLQVTETVLI